jgi:hypothetical protein
MRRHVLDLDTFPIIILKHILNDAGQNFLALFEQIHECHVTARTNKIIWPIPKWIPHRRWKHAAVPRILNSPTVALAENFEVSEFALVQLTL